MLEMIMNGNTTLSGEVVKSFQMGSCPVVLTTGGNLYVNGNANRLANTGVDINVLTTWKLIDTNVETFGFSGSSALLWRRSDKSWWAIGYFSYMFNALVTNVKVDVSSKCTAIPSDANVTKIAGGVNIFVITDTGDLYGCGRNAWLQLGSTATNPTQNFIKLTNVTTNGVVDVISGGSAGFFIDKNKQYLLTGNDMYGVSGGPQYGNRPNGYVCAQGVDKILDTNGTGVHILRGDKLSSTGIQYYGQLGDGVNGGDNSGNYRTSWFDHPGVYSNMVTAPYGLFAKAPDGWYFTGRLPIYNAQSYTVYTTLTKMDTSDFSPDCVFVNSPSSDLQIMWDKGKLFFRGATHTYKIPGYTSTPQLNWVELPLTGIV